MVAPLWVQCMYKYAKKKSSGYVSDSIKIEFHSEAVKSEDYLRVKIKS